jgi:hypothetical protein
MIAAWTAALVYFRIMANMGDSKVHHDMWQWTCKRHHENTPNSDIPWEEKDSFGREVTERSSTLGVCAVPLQCEKGIQDAFWIPHMLLSFMSSIWSSRALKTDH